MPTVLTVWFEVGKPKAEIQGENCKRNPVCGSSGGKEIGSTRLTGVKGLITQEQSRILLSVTTHNMSLGSTGSNSKISVVLTVPGSKGDLQNIFGRLVPFACLQNAIRRGDRKYFQVVIMLFLFICSKEGKYQTKQYETFCIVLYSI